MDHSYSFYFRFQLLIKIDIIYFFNYLKNKLIYLFVKLSNFIVQFRKHPNLGRAIKMKFLKENYGTMMNMSHGQPL